MEHTIYLLTGSNVGDAALNLEIAFTHIQQTGRISRQSSVYLTEPWGNKNQNAFLNQVLELLTEFSPLELMQELLRIEQEMGRKRTQKWEPRIIDIDILFFDDLIIEGELIIPHPLLHERRFTLEPLFELTPDFVHPFLKLSVRDLLEQCKDEGKVNKL